MYIVVAAWLGSGNSAGAEPGCVGVGPRAEQPAVGRERGAGQRGAASRVQRLRSTGGRARRRG
jgi:hypothetical protein